ncbi:hypothetical protein GGR56DRAFT_688564 [Xylariaceae sp. FL0804]|nr:hypothetical protein GGR56DRAFT_688564 [Xylariaceae sp. FL0804]
MEKFEKGRRVPRPAKFTGDIVIFELPSGKHYAIHATLLTHFSGYYRHQLNSLPADGNEVFRFKVQCDDRIMSVFVHWAYKQDDKDYEFDNSDFLTSETPAVLWVDTWLFGEYLQAPAFQNVVLKDFHGAMYDNGFQGLIGLSKSKGGFPTATILRSFLIDAVHFAFAWEFGEDARYSLLKELPADILLQISMRLARAVPQEGVVLEWSDDYLVKETDEETDEEADEVVEYILRGERTNKPTSSK